jgi:hypothetical protein
LDTTATVTVPVALALLVLLALLELVELLGLLALLVVLVALLAPVLELPLLEHAAAVVTIAATHAAAASLRFLNLEPNLDELMNEPPQR